MWNSWYLIKDPPSLLKDQQADMIAKPCRFLYAFRITLLSTISGVIFIFFFFILLLFLSFFLWNAMCFFFFCKNNLSLFSLFCIFFFYEIMQLQTFAHRGLHARQMPTTFSFSSFLNHINQWSVKISVFWFSHLIFFSFIGWISQNEHVHVLNVKLIFCIKKIKSV